MQNISIENPTIRAASRDKNYWREMVTNWQKSNENPKDFCKKMNIKLGTFDHWRGVFKKEEKCHANKFIELKVETRPKQLDKLVIECPSGHKIIFTSALKMDEAQEMFKLLGLI